MKPNPKYEIDYAEFYITNVCNLACPGCNHFNNFNLKGYWRWNDLKETYSQWSQELDIKSIAILGGEPLLNPEFLNWAVGVSELWPDCMVRIISNGLQIDRVKGFYDVLKSNPRIKLWVGIHNKKHKQEIINKVKKFLSGDCTIKFDQSNYYQSYMLITDSNNVTVRIEYNWWFHQGAIVKNLETKTLQLHSSDPEKSHAICHMKYCHTFINGLLYKCGPAALFNVFDHQYPLTLNDSDRQLLTQYQPLSINDSNEHKIDFFKNLKNAIPQCKFCPEAYQGDQIWAEKKTKLHLS